MAGNPIEENLIDELAATMKIINSRLGESDFIDSEIYGLDQKQMREFFELWVQVAAVKWFEKRGVPHPYPQDVMDMSMKCFLMGVVYARRELGKETNQ